MRASVGLLCLLLSIIPNVAFSTFAWSSGQCATLPATQAVQLVNPCAAVVNYAFYVPPGETLKTLQDRARASLNNTNLLQFSSTCVSNVVAFHCSKIYLKCVPNVVLSQPTTYDYLPYAQLGQNYGIPFQRPCKSVCTAVATGCSGLYLKLFGPPDCTASEDYSNGDVAAPYPKRFEPNNNASHCYAPLTVTFAGMKERYTRSKHAPCAGYIDQFLIPFANKINANYTFLQLPRVVQNLLNTALSTQFAQVPGFVTTPCYHALLQYQCYSLFLTPVKRTIYQALIGGGMSVTQANALASGALSALAIKTTSFTLPEYPAPPVCNNFVTQCARLLPRLVTRNPALSSNCSAVVPGTTTGTKRFPTGNQTVAALSILTGLPSPAPAQLTLRFITGSNDNVYYNETELSTLSTDYQPSCPTGFVIPDDPNADGNRWIQGTSCALACRSPLWDPDEWDTYRNNQIGFPIAGFAVGIVFLIFLILTQSVKDTYIIITFTVLSLIASMDAMYLTHYDLEEGFCYNNAIEIKQHDDQPDSDQSACVAQGAILVYTYFAGCCCFFMLAVDWRLKHYPELYKTIQESYQYLYYTIQFFCCLVFSFVPMIYAYVEDLLGFSRTKPWCFVRSWPSGPEDVDIAVVTIPILILMGTYFLIFCGFDLFGFCANFIPHTGESFKAEGIYSAAHRRAIFAATTVTIVMSFILYAPFIAATANLSVKRDDYQDSLADWTTCVFQNYNAADPNHCFDVCGSHPHTRPRTDLLPYQLLILTGNLIIIAPAYMIAYSITYWVKANESGPNYAPVTKATTMDAPVANKEEEDNPGAVIEMTATQERI